MPTTLSSQQRRLRASLASNHRWANTPRRNTVHRTADLQQFEDQVDPDRELSDVERIERATNAQQAHNARQAFEASKSETSEVAS